MPSRRRGRAVADRPPFPRRPARACAARWPPSPRRPSTATSATGPIRWRPTAPSGARDNRGVMIRVLGAAGRSFDASGKPRRRAGGQSLSLPCLADLRRARRRRAQARAGPLRRHAVRGIGAAAAGQSRRGAGGAACRRLLARRLRRSLRRLLRAHQRGRARSLPQGAGRQRRGHAVGAERISGSVLERDVMAGLVPAIHALILGCRRRGCPRQARA